MLNYIWGGFILLGIIVAFFRGTMPEVTNAAINGGRDAVNLAITMLGVIATWTGVIKIAQKGGMIELAAKKMRPLLRFLFPSVPDHHPAQEYIATNFIANFLGLGWAATPAGLAAMKELDQLNHGRETASHAMCMFLIVNMSSVQLISVNIIAYRAQYESKSPTEILGACILATLFSTVAGILFAKMMGGRGKE